MRQSNPTPEQPLLPRAREQSRGKSRKCPSPTQRKQPQPHPRIKKKQKKKKKRGGENHLIESQRLENPLGVREDEMLWSLWRQPGFPCPGEAPLPPEAAGWGSWEQHPSRDMCIPTFHPRECSGLRGQDRHEDRAQSWERRGQGADLRAKTPAALVPAALPCTCPGMLPQLGSCWPGGWGSHCSFAQPCLNLLSLVIHLKANTDRSKHKVSKPTY